MGVSPALYGPVAAYQGVAGASAQLGRENRSNSAKIEEISATLSGVSLRYAANWFVRRRRECAARRCVRRRMCCAEETSAEGPTE